MGSSSYRGDQLDVHHDAVRTDNFKLRNLNVISDYKLKGNGVDSTMDVFCPTIAEALLEALPFRPSLAALR
jgi:hypothetical protein